jgi:sigma-B regulation protein RsbU (phosphoserine phosphatase)
MDVDLQEGEVLLFFTDGLTEAMNEQGEEFGEERLLEVVRATPAATADAVVQAVRDAVDSHRAGCEVSDDFTLLAAEIRPRVPPK